VVATRLDKLQLTDEIFICLPLCTAGD